ncbi:hypothetical protein [Micrococcoides hystricis]|uniref:Uncharacterized protein n=1 Tax=Micrococcoides hystricis TaxID=1572761 RepID=A0ABV6P7M6_9MICC
MAEKKPLLSELRAGWASIENEGSNLGQVNAEPPESVPEIVEADLEIPRMLRARFYYWDAPPAGFRENQDIDPRTVRKLNAIDVMITSQGSGKLALLFSTRTRTYLNRKMGVIASLNSILKSTDANQAIDRYESPFRLTNEEIFLWLAVQHRDKPQLANDIFLEKIEGISSRDRTSRTADLRYGVDFDRSNFLTAVAEKDTLGPMDICFIRDVGTEKFSYEVKLHFDGGFEIKRNNILVPEELNHNDFMLTTSLDLAYKIIPRFNILYQNDAAKWRTQRVDVIEKAMSALEARYKSLRQVLQKQLDK